jgi:large subunit ribosomal protein L29
MEMDKILNLDEEELALQAHQAAEQIFRLRFQLRMGQNEGVKKLRELKKDIARIKTVERQRELGIITTAHPSETKPKRATKKAAKSKPKAAKGKSVKAKKTSKAASKKTSKTGGKAKASKTAVKSAKRGKANAKKGGS